MDNAMLFLIFVCGFLFALLVAGAIAEVVDWLWKRRFKNHI
jgi:hypothetical protein